MPTPTLGGFIPLKNTPDEYPDLTRNKLQWAIRHRENNGLSDSGALARLGRDWFINPAKFLDWMRGQV